jgi:hypothetical protein
VFYHLKWFASGIASAKIKVLYARFASPAGINPLRVGPVI